MADYGVASRPLLASHRIDASDVGWDRDRHGLSQRSCFGSSKWTVTVILDPCPRYRSRRGEAARGRTGAIRTGTCSRLAIVAAANCGAPGSLLGVAGANITICAGHDRLLWLGACPFSHKLRSRGEWNSRLRLSGSFQEKCRLRMAYFGEPFFRRDRPKRLNGQAPRTNGCHHVECRSSVIAGPHIKRAPRRCRPPS
jgi:hypothetical protein